ncbi:MAG TPA: hypothetical protein VF883_12910 [Thermoanaerobaculia bacterium]|jgi:hypothetical protein
MNSKRRAELQRKLSLNAVPRPPAGLQERIKGDIPKYLKAERGNSAFNLRIAASILLVASTAAVTMYLVGPQAKEQMVADAASATRPVVFAPQKRAINQTAPSAPTEEVRLEISEDSAVELPSRLMATNAPPPLPARRSDERDTEMLREEAKAESSGVTGNVAGGLAVGAQPQQMAKAEPAPVPPPSAVAAPAAAPAPPVPAMADAAAAERITVTAEAPRIDFVQRAHAATIPLGRKDSVFGISVNPGVFHAIRDTLERHERPNPGSIDLEALVNYFAGRPEGRPREGVRFDVEASPAAVNADGDHAILRFTLDTPDAQGAGSIPPAAKDASIEVSFNDKVVAHARRIGDADELSTEPILLHGTSVTALYAIELKPNLKSNQLVASVRLRYTSLSNGSKHTITRTVRGQDLARSWQRATRRHRLASLGAVWGETLRGTAPAFDVAQRAEELATQEPKNSHAQELARVITASTSGGF